jgi:hypothetical protein
MCANISLGSSLSPSITEEVRTPGPTDMFTTFHGEVTWETVGICQIIGPLRSLDPGITLLP